METKSIEASLGRKTSSMWYFFTIIDDNVARCKNCRKTLSYRSSTSNLKKHLQKSHPPLFEELQSGRVPSTYKVGKNGDGNADADDDPIERSFDVYLEENFNDDVNDEDYTPPKKKTNIQLKSEIKSPMSFKPQTKAVVARNIVHNSSRLKPMVEYDDSGDEEDNEFNLLGKFICSQLQKLTKVNAFLAQEEIQSVLTRYKVHELSTEEKAKMMPNTKL